MCGFQNPAQPVQAAAGVALDGAQRHSGAVRDLGLGEVLVEGEAQYLPLVPGQAGESVQQDDPVEHVVQCRAVGPRCARAVRGGVDEGEASA